MEHQRYMETLERSFKENVGQLKRKLQEEKELFLREQRMMLQHKLMGGGRCDSVVPDGPGALPRMGQVAARLCEEAPIPFLVVIRKNYEY
jgi:hypothetical protein